MICPRCQADNPSSARFCGNCGAPLTQRCANCGAELQPGARFCISCGQPVNAVSPQDAARLSRLVSSAPILLAQKIQAGARLSGERRVVTVLFADVVGSTSLAEQVDIEAWSGIMNGVFEVATEAVYRYEGTIARLLGDTLVAFFGAPVAHEDDPKRAVLAGLDFVASARRYAAEVRDKHAIDLAVRACLNTGPVILGKVDRDLRYDFTAIGGAVNLAARIKFAAKPMTVVLTEDCHRHIAPFFECTDLGPVEVKNRPTAVRVYQVHRPKPTPGSLRGLAGLHSDMVGRDAELRTLLGLCDAVRAGLGRGVLVVGEPGVGKTRLIAEWKQAAQNQGHVPPALWIEGRCLSYGQSTAYQLVASIVRGFLGLPEDAEPASAEIALEARLNDLFDPLDLSSGGDRLETEIFLGHLLSLSQKPDALARVGQLDPQGLQGNYVQALRRLLLRLTSRHPVVVVMEDLHWADPSSVEVLSSVLPLVSSCPLLLCLVSRMDRDSPGWKLISSARERLGGALTEIVLEALSEEYTRQLIANLLEIEALPEQMRSLILQRSEGNPLFVEEVIRMLIDRGAIVSRDGRWFAEAEIANVEIPDNLQGLLMARIDRLPEHGKEILRVASVVGRQFAVRVLEQVMGNGRNGSSTRATLNDLEMAGLIRVAKVEPELEYHFRHTLLQEAAYASVLAADRQRLHLTVGEAVEHLYPDRASTREWAPRLGLHFAEGGDTRRALKYFTLAGHAALATYANREAENDYRDALGLVADPREQAELLWGLGEAMFGQSRFSEAIATWREGIEVYSNLGDSCGKAKLYARSARAAWYSGDTPEGLRLCLKGLDRMGVSDECPELAQLVHEAARASYFNGLPERARTLCQQALEMAERLGAVDVQADALATLGVLPGVSPEEAISSLMRAVELGETRGNLQIAARAHHNLANELQAYRWDQREGLAHFRRSAEIARQRGTIFEEIFSLYAHTTGLLLLGDIDGTEEQLDTIESLFMQLPDPGPVRIEYQSIQACLAFLAGQWQEALALLRAGLDSSRQKSDHQNIISRCQELADVLHQLTLWGVYAGWTEAEAILKEAVECGDRMGVDRVHPRAQLSVMHARQGDIAGAHMWLQEAEGIKGPRPGVWDTLYLATAIPELASAEQRWDDAVEAWGELVGLHNRLGARLFLGRSLTGLAEAHAERKGPGDLERAQALLREAVEVWRDLHSAFLADLTEQKLGRLQALALEYAQQQGQAVLELEQAGRIQETFLPELPAIPGWDLAASLKPARETSGDFYDFLKLPDGRLGIVIADVADKGAGAALLMASTRAMLRTFADQFPSQPDRVFLNINRRLLLDSRSGLFVTLFYGILDPDTGDLVYSSAGHLPGLLQHAGEAAQFRELGRTGMPLGVTEEAAWQVETEHLGPGARLVLYTDGVSEAQSPSGDYYGAEGLTRVLGQSRDQSAGRDVEHLLQDVLGFMGDSEQGDDLTLVVVKRETLKAS